MNETRREAAAAVVATLRRAGYEAYFAGGCVRDELLGRTPEDYDVATDARPEDVERLFERTHTAGKQFAVVNVRDDRAVTEVATFRKDLGYSDGRHPDGIEFVDARADAERRDFTVNGMFLDPQTGDVLDYVGGREDLAARRIRAIGDPRVRFVEDRLRLVRAARFAAKLRFSIEAATAEAIRSMARVILDVSAERIAQELSKGLLDPSRGEFIRVLDDVGLLDVILPEVSAMKDVPYHCAVRPEGSVLDHAVMTLERLEAPSLPLALAALLNETGKACSESDADDADEDTSGRVVAGIASRLKLANAVRDRMEWLVRQHARFVDAAGMRPAAMRRLFAEEGFAELAHLARAKALASEGSLAAYEDCLHRFEALPATELRPRRMITGDDLLGMGVEPGPIFAELLEAVYDEQLAGRITSRANGIAFVAELLRQRALENEKRTS